MGQAIYRAPTSVWRPLLPWLVWGQFTHVGKNAVKGDGWYEIEIGDEHANHHPSDS